MIRFGLLALLGSGCGSCLLAFVLRHRRGEEHVRWPSTPDRGGGAVLSFSSHLRASSFACRCSTVRAAARLVSGLRGDRLPGRGPGPLSSLLWRFRGLCGRRLHLGLGSGLLGGYALRLFLWRIYRATRNERTQSPAETASLLCHVKPSPVSSFCLHRSRQLPLKSPLPAVAEPVTFHVKHRP